jgi:DTW domain-containing protein YfiP
MLRGVMLPSLGPSLGHLPAVAQQQRPPRVTCLACRRPQSVCYCAHVTPMDTRTRVLLLQHPRERDVPIGTARMASLCLRNAELHVGLRWPGTEAVARALSDPSRPAALLYPGPGAVDVMSRPPAGPVTLVVVDGTWSQTRKVVRDNPALASLPRYAFEPPSPSEYRIRSEPHPAYVSTIEALAYVLGALEGDPVPFRALLRPVRAMVDAQLACEARFRDAPARHVRRPKGPPALPPLPACLRDRAADLVCVAGEANAWPYGSPERSAGLADELVHWVAYRVTTGETFDAVVAPRIPLAPRTPRHVALTADTLAAGCTVAELLERWRAFVRDTDVVCSWGRYATSLFVSTGASLPPLRVDLRQVARVRSGGKVGTLEELVARLGLPPAPGGAGRARVRTEQIAAVARHLRAAT